VPPDMATRAICLQKLASRVRLLKNDAAPQARVPPVTNATNYRGRGYNSRRYDSRCDDNWRRRCDYDWPVRPTMSIRTTVKARTTSALSAGTINTDE